jgi:hypothetical protein
MPRARSECDAEQHIAVRHLLIDGGFHTLQFTVIGLILALWH